MRPKAGKLLPDASNGTAALWQRQESPRSLLRVECEQGGMLSCGRPRAQRHQGAAGVVAEGRQQQGLAIWLGCLASRLSQRQLSVEIGRRRPSSATPVAGGVDPLLFGGEAAVLEHRWGASCRCVSDHRQWALRSRIWPHVSHRRPANLDRRGRPRIDAATEAVQHADPADRTGTPGAVGVASGP